MKRKIQLFVFPPAYPWHVDGIERDFLRRRANEANISVSSGFYEAHLNIKFCGNIIPRVADKSGRAPNHFMTSAMNETTFYAE